MKRWTLLLALAVLTPAAAATNTAQDVLNCMRANVPSAVRSQEIELDATDRVGATRTLKGKLYALSEKTAAGGSLVRAMMRISDPSSHAGAAYLVREAEDSAREGMYVYLPSVRRVRRVTGSFADGSLLGTNFSYNDLKLLANSFVGSAIRLEAPDQVEQRPVHVLTFKTVVGGGSPHSLGARLGRSKSCVALKADFLGSDGVRKRLNSPAASLTQSGGHWFASQVQMDDLKDGTKTVLHIGKVMSLAEVPTRYFNPEMFYLGN